MSKIYCSYPKTTLIKKTQLTNKSRKRTKQVENMLAKIFLKSVFIF